MSSSSQIENELASIDFIAASNKLASKSTSSTGTTLTCLSLNHQNFINSLTNGSSDLIDKLPTNVKFELDQLELELIEGDITQKGYDKKRAKLLAPFLNTSHKLEQLDNANSVSSSSSSKQETTTNSDLNNAILELKKATSDKSNNNSNSTDSSTSSKNKILVNKRVKRNKDSLTNDQEPNRYHSGIYLTLPYKLFSFLFKSKLIITLVPILYTNNIDLYRLSCGN
jgi:hypothetical protein